MGSVRPTYIKRVVFELLEKHSSEFNTDYQHNKDAVDRFTDLENKMMRNRIAGYVTTCKKRGM